MLQSAMWPANGRALRIGRCSLKITREREELRKARRILVKRRDYGFALALVTGIVAGVIAVLTSFGVEAKNVAFGLSRTQPQGSQP
jgi:hypothetical protein